MKQVSYTKQTLRLYLNENLRYKWLFAATNVSWVSGITLQKLVLPLIVAGAFDLIIENQKHLQWSLFTTRFVIFVVVAAFSQLFIDIGLYLLSKLETRSIISLHRRIYDHLIHQSMHFHNNSFSGALVNQTNRLVTGYVVVSDTFTISISQTIILLFFSAAVLFFYSPLLAITMFTWSVIFLYINVRLTVRRIVLGKARAAADSKLTGYLADSMGNIGAIKTFSAESYELKSYNHLATDRAQKGYAYWILSIKNDAFFGGMMVGLQLLVLAVSIFAVMHKSITIGTLVLAQVYITQTIANLWGLSNITKNLEPV
jgi:ABC-type bacteriocin/lantibiotic exporter with double-glycine peptidase domain